MQVGNNSSIPQMSFLDHNILTPSILVILFELSSVKKEFNETEIDCLFDKINEFDSSKGFDQEQIDQIVSISVKIFPDIKSHDLKNKNIKFFEKHLQYDEAFQYLRLAKYAKNDSFVLKALNCIDKATELRLKINEDHTLTIDTIFTSLSYETISTIISTLEDIYDGNINIKLSRPHRLNSENFYLYYK